MSIFDLVTLVRLASTDTGINLVSRPYTNPNMFTVNRPKNGPERTVKRMGRWDGKMRRYPGEGFKPVSRGRSYVVSQHPALRIPPCPAVPPEDIIEILTEHPALSSKNVHRWCQHLQESVQQLPDYPFEGIDPFITKRKAIIKMKYCDKYEHILKSLEEVVGRHEIVYAAWQISEVRDGVFLAEYIREYLYKEDGWEEKREYLCAPIEPFYYWFDRGGVYHAEYKLPEE